MCRLLIAFANNLDPDQARQNVGPDLDPNSLILCISERFFQKVGFEKKITRRQKTCKVTNLGKPRRDGPYFEIPTTYILLKIRQINHMFYTQVLYVCSPDALSPSQQFISHVETFSILLKYIFALFNSKFNRTKF